VHPFKTIGARLVLDDSWLSGRPTKANP